MKKYVVSLVRGYVVAISAKSEQEAKRFAEYYIGGESDLSDEREKERFQFRIEHIEMTTNDAIDIEEHK